MEFMPHGSCYLWRGSMIWSFLITDGIIALSYFAIPFLLWVILRKLRAEIPEEFKFIFGLFISFIAACGLTHLLSMAEIWYPLYRLHIVVNALTAFVSFTTAVCLIPLSEKIFSYIKQSEQQEQELIKSQRMLELFLEQSPVAAYVKDAQSRILYYNRKVCHWFQISPQQWIGLTDREFLNPEVGDRILENDRHVLETGLPLDVVEEIQLPDGKTLHLLSCKFAFTDPATGEQRLGGVSIDMTDRSEAQRSLQAVNQELGRKNLQIQVLNEMTGALHVCIAEEEAYEIISLAAKRLFPKASGAIFIVSNSGNYAQSVSAWGEQHSDTVFSPNACWGLRRGVPNVVIPHQPGLTCSHLHNPESGSHLCIPLLGQGEILGTLYLHFNEQSAEEIDEATIIVQHASPSLNNLKLKQKLLNWSIRDPLTNLYNRRYLEETLDRELIKARRSNSSVGCIMFDLDHFKRCNDTYGHIAADEVLRATADRLRKKSRASDMAVRYGGEEMVLVLIETDLENTAAKAEQILEDIRSHPVEYQGDSIRVTASAGVAAYPESAATCLELLNAADGALYQAKNRGRDRVEIAGRDKP